MVAADKIEEVKNALAEAHEAADAAVKSFVYGKAVGPDGFINDTSGNAVLLVRRPSYAFREALKVLGEVDHWTDGWAISHFSRHTKGPASHSCTAHTRACEAALAVLKSRFPKEDFSVHSWVD
jgi:hypothetical protein